jgi:HD superfamily phosphohydrolase
MIIKDPIYGFVDVPEICQSFIDTYEFQRLRGIKQLGLACYVYPSATHTRFEHSLGVMHLAGQVADQLEINQHDKTLLQIAGLMHDVGHCAFSHLIDYILEEEKVGESHEERSIQVLERINKKKKLLSEDDLNIVKKMILGQDEGEENKYLYQIVCNSSSGLDVDKMDYLQRDAYHIGLPGFRPDYIVRCMTLQDRELYVKEKSRIEIECMYEVRRRMFQIVYRHKTVLNIEDLMREGISKMELTNGWAMDVWLGLDDSMVELTLQRFCPELMMKLYTRSWDRKDIEDRFKHVKCIDRKDIDDTVRHVKFC